MAAGATGGRVVFFGSHKRPSYVVERYFIPRKEDLQDGEILIKVLMTTICPLDLNYIDGRREVKTPCVLGHEGVGEVILISEGINAVQPGDRVSFVMCIKCGLCCTCDEDKRETSRNLKFDNTDLKDRCSLNGTYSTHLILKPKTHIVCIPPNVPESVACPANCSLALMMNALDFLSCDKTTKRSIAVVQGANLMGLYACCVLREEGFQKVYCHDISSKRLELVPSFKAIPILVKNELCNSGLAEKSVDLVIDVCGEWDVVEQGLSMLRVGAIYLFAATKHDKRRHSMIIDTVIKKNLTIKGFRGYKKCHLQKAIEFLSKTADCYPYESLVSPAYSMQDFHAAVECARSNLFYRTAIKP